MSFFTDNWKELLLAATSIVTVASLIAKRTKNVYDDKITSAILRFLSLAPKAPK